MNERTASGSSGVRAPTSPRTAAITFVPLPVTAAKTRTGPAMGTEDRLLDRDRVVAWLAGEGIVPPGSSVEVATIASGYSNVMFVLTIGDRRMVLRRPAAVPLPRADEGMRREFRFLGALEGSDVPHPAPIAFCEDADVTGAVFYVMGHVDGFMPTDPLPEAFTSVEAHRELAFAVTDAIAALSCVDWRAAGIADLGRPEGFHERQVRRWMTQYTSYPEQELPGIERIGEWLDAAHPVGVGAGDHARRLPHREPAGGAGSPGTRRRHRRLGDGDDRRPDARPRRLPALLVRDPAGRGVADAARR